MHRKSRSCWLCPVLGRRIEHPDICRHTFPEALLIRNALILAMHQNIKLRSSCGRIPGAQARASRGSGLNERPASGSCKPDVNCL
jgi:hypothetical protein